MIDLLLISLGVVTAFLLKAAAVTSIASRLAQSLPDRLSAWLAAWIIVLAAQIVWTLSVSVAGALNGATAWLFLVLLLLVSSHKLDPQATIRRFLDVDLNKIGVSGVSIASVVLILFCIRSFVFSDFTHDAFTYGLVRLSVWKNYSSVLVFMPTEQINIFTNEWNGELICLWYGLLVNDIQGFNFGNVEILFVTLLSATWLSYRLGANERLALGVGLLTTFTPAVLGLAATVKGDLLACTGIMMAAGWLTTVRHESNRWWAFLMTPACVGLAIGAKISAVFGGVLILLPLLAAFIPSWKKPSTYWGILGSVLLVSIFSSRYWINAVQLGDPLSRAGGESAQPGIATLVGSLQILGPQFFQFFPNLEPYYAWALFGGLGVSGAICGVLALLSLKNLSPLSRLNTTLGLAAILGTIITFAVIPPRIWGFRYALPVVLVGIVVLATSVAGLKRGRLIAQVLPFAILPNFISILLPGEILPNISSMGWKWLTRSVSSTSAYRAHSIYPGLYETIRIDTFGLDTPFGEKIAIRNQIDSFVFPLVGSKAQNRLIFANDLERLKDIVSQQNPKFLVVRTSGSITETEREFVENL